VAYENRNRVLALAFVNVSIIHASAGSSAAGLSAYMAREERVDTTTGQVFDFTARGSDLVATGMLLPDHVPAELRDGGKLWSAAAEAEMVIDRRNRLKRYAERGSPQVAKHLIIALPWDDEITDAHRVEMAKGIVGQEFTAAGVAVEWAVHRYGTAFKPTDSITNAEVRAQIELVHRLGIEKINLKAGEDLPTHLRGPHVLVWQQPDGSERWQLYQPHAHVLVSTRRICDTGFRTEKGRPTEKARELNPEFSRNKGRAKGYVSEEDQWRHRWRDYQTTYFAEHGLTVAVQEDRMVPDRHRGKARSRGINTDVETADREAERQEAALDPDRMLDHLMQKQSTFTRRDLVNELRRHGVGNAEVEEAADRVIVHDRVVMLCDPQTGQFAGVFTTHEVRAEEEGALAAWMELAARKMPVRSVAIRQAAAEANMDGEQVVAFAHALAPVGAVCIQGDPGTGKSYTMRWVRRAMELGGLRCIGASTMNTVAQDMKDPKGAGFKEADTLASLIGRLEEGRLKIAGMTALLIDEAAMTDNVMLGRVAAQALRWNLKVAIIGDDKQNPSVARGGLYTDIREAIGEARLTDVKRHDLDWQKQATKDLAAGRIAEGIGAYQANGRIVWTETLEEARATVVATATKAMADGRNVYVLASTNREVDQINPALRAARALPPGLMVDTKRGRLEISQGDRVQLYASRKREGLYNATFGMVERVDLKTQHLTVLFDDGHRATIKSDRFRDFGYGYAGTVYRDQGKSRPLVLPLYDSKWMWGRETTLVGLSRQKIDVKLFVPRELAATREALVHQMSQSRARRSSLAWATPAQVAAPPPPTPPQQENSNAQSARRPAAGRFANRFAEAAARGAGYGENVASVQALNRLPGLRGSDVAQREGRPERTESVLPDHAPNQLRREPVHPPASSGLRRPGPVEPPMVDAPVQGEPSAEQIAATAAVTEWQRLRQHSPAAASKIAAGIVMAAEAERKVRIPGPYTVAAGPAWTAIKGSASTYINPGDLAATISAGRPEQIVAGDDHADDDIAAMSSS